MQVLSAIEAAALVRSTDTLGIPLGPGQPGDFLHALGTRDDWTDLLVGGALITDFYELFGRPNVRFLSGFYGPLERLMRDQGGAIEFVPADFRRFGPTLEQVAPRVFATAVHPPDEVVGRTDMWVAEVDGTIVALMVLDPGRDQQGWIEHHYHDPAWIERQLRTVSSLWYDTDGNERCEACDDRRSGRPV